MTTKKKKAFNLAILAIGLLSLFQITPLYQAYFPNRDHPMIPELSNMQTFCIGRYAVDLPVGSKLFRNEFGINDLHMTELGPMSESAYGKLVKDRWDNLLLLDSDDRFTPPEPYTQPSQIHKLQDGSVIFTLRHRNVTARWPDGTSGTEHFYDTESYIKKGGLVFKFQGGRVREAAQRTMSELEVSPESQSISSSGFCTVNAFFRSPPAQGESVSVAFELPDSGVQFRITYPVDPPPDRSAIHAFTSSDLHTKRIRSASRTVNGMTGNESIHSGTERKGPEAFDSSIGAWWDFPGPLAQYPEYGMAVSLEYNVQTTTPPPQPGALPPAKTPSEVDEQKFLALWDGILKTLRPIPGAQ